MECPFIWGFSDQVFATVLTEEETSVDVTECPSGYKNVLWVCGIYSDVIQRKIVTLARPAEANPGLTTIMRVIDRAADRAEIHVIVVVRIRSERPCVPAVGSHKGASGLRRGCKLESRRGRTTTYTRAEKTSSVSFVRSSPYFKVSGRRQTLTGNPGGYLVDDTFVKTTRQTLLLTEKGRPFRVGPLLLRLTYRLR